MPKALLFVFFFKHVLMAGFFPWGTGGPPVGENLVTPPLRHSSPFSDQSLSPSTRHLSPKNFSILSTFFIDFYYFQAWNYLKWLKFNLGDILASAENF